MRRTAPPPRSWRNCRRRRQWHWPIRTWSRSSRHKALNPAASPPRTSVSSPRSRSKNGPTWSESPAPKSTDAQEPSMKPFVYTAQAGRVVFRADVWSTLKPEVAQLGAGKAMVLCTPRQRALAERALEVLEELGAGIHDQAIMHVPVDAVQKAVKAVKEAGAGCVVALGGGSTIGLAKAMALEAALPILAVPTTYSGSEMTSIYGITEGGVKKTGKDPRALPRTVIYDPSLSLHLPLGISVVSGLNAMAHAAEGLYAQDGNPLLSLLSEDGIRAMTSGLRRLSQQPQDVQARSECLYGAWLCGIVLGSA